MTQCVIRSSHIPRKGCCSLSYVTCPMLCISYTSAILKLYNYYVLGVSFEVKVAVRQDKNEWIDKQCHDTEKHHAEHRTREDSTSWSESSKENGNHKLQQSKSRRGKYKQRNQPPWKDGQSIAASCTKMKTTTIQWKN